MKLYKKKQKVILFECGGQGFRDKTTDLTDWLDEDDPQLEITAQEAERKYSGIWTWVKIQEKFELFENKG